jgi:hypothetical protein
LRPFAIDYEALTIVRLLSILLQPRQHTRRAWLEMTGVNQVLVEQSQHSLMCLWVVALCVQDRSGGVEELLVAREFVDAAREFSLRPPPV